jgi:hypothetical protein
MQRANPSVHESLRDIRKIWMVDLGSNLDKRRVEAAYMRVHPVKTRPIRHLKTEFLKWLRLLA